MRQTRKTILAATQLLGKRVRAITAPGELMGIVGVRLPVDQQDPLAVYVSTHSFGISLLGRAGVGTPPR